MRTSNRCTTWNLKKLADGQTVRGLVTLCRMRRADGKVSKYVLQLTQIHRGTEEERNAYQVGRGESPLPGQNGKKKLLVTDGFLC